MELTVINKIKQIDLMSSSKIKNDLTALFSIQK